MLKGKTRVVDKQVVQMLILQGRIALCSPLWSEQHTSPHVVTGVLQVFSVNAYALFDLGATLSFVTPLVARNLIFY